MTFTVGDLQSHLGKRLTEFWTSPTGRLRKVTCVTRVAMATDVAQGLPGEVTIVESGEDCTQWLVEVARGTSQPGLTALLCNASCVSQGGRDVLRELADQAPIAMGLLSSETSICQIANDLSRVLATMSGNPAPSELNNAETLQDLAESLGRLVENSVTIETPNHELLANSPAGGDIDQDRIETILHRRAAAKVMQHRDFKSFFSRVRSSDWPLHLQAQPDFGFSGRVAVRIAQEGEILGVIWVTDTARPLGESDYATIRQAAAVAAGIIGRQRLGTRREALLRAELLEELVSGRIVDPENIRAIGLTVGWNVDRIQHVLVATIDDFEAFRLRHSRGGSTQLYREQDRLLDLVKLEVHGFDHNAVIGMRSSSIVILAALGSGEPADRKRNALRLASSIIKKTAAFLTEVTLTIGVGRESPSLEYLTESFHQADVAVQLGQSLWGGNRVVHYDELGIHRVLFALREDEGMITPALRRVLEYDRMHNTDYVITLRAFLNHMGRLRPAAEELNIHRNTLEYRMGRIAEVAGIPFEEPDNRLALELGLRVLELNQG